MFRRLTTLLFAIGTLAILTTSARSEPLAEDQQRYWISLGGLFAEIDTSIDVRREGESGSGSDLEQRFGLDASRNEFRAEGQILFNSRHRLFVGWMAFTRTTTGTLDEDFEYGDVTYSAMSDFELKNDTSFLTVGYRWDALDRENFELGLSIAPVFVDTETTLSGEGTVSDGMTTVPFAGSRSAGVTAPAPLVGIHFDWNNDRKYWVRTSFQYITADLGDFDGSMFEGELRFDWFPTEHFGLGLGYSYVDITLDDFEQEKFDGSYDSTYASLFGYLTFKF